MAYRQKRPNPKHDHAMVPYPNDPQYRYCATLGCTHAERWRSDLHAYAPALGRPKRKPTADPVPLFPDLPPVPPSVRRARRVKRG